MEQRISSRERLAETSPGSGGKNRISKRFNIVWGIWKLLEHNVQV